MTEAIDPARHAFVAASAGTGKTWLLAARVTRLLLAGARADGILALTFTRKAAGEMHERVLSRLRSMAFADDAGLRAIFAELHVPYDAPLAGRARALYEELLYAPLPLRAMTLHAFAQDLVSRFALQCGVPPGAEPAEDEGELVDAAWHRLQDELRAQPQAAPARALALLIEHGATEFTLRRIVTGFLEQRNDWRAYTQDQAAPLDFLDADLRAQLQLDAQAEPWAALDAADADELLRTLHAGLVKIGGAGSIKPAPLEPALHARGQARWQALAATLLKQDGKARDFKISKKLQEKLAAAELDAFIQAKDELLVRTLHARGAQLAAITHARTLAGCTLGAAALAHFEDEARRRLQLPFADIEWHAGRLLREPDTAAWAAYKLDQRIDHLLLDEFQDTSHAQWQLLLPALREIAAGGERARSVFVVGDAKQSIYGFRRAAPELMQQAQDWVQQRPAGWVDTLARSRRSAPAVIEFVNAVFAQDEARRLLPDFPPHATYRDDWGRVELAPLIEADDAGDEPAPAFRDPPTQAAGNAENARAHAEGELIARRIRELVDARWQIDDAQGRRALGYGDIFILLQRRTHQQQLERALIAAGIPYAGAARGTLLLTVEARDLTALLRLL
ncbi:MAG TPA: UvrD-helicase domain-containing protein, partial [Nevskiaceae bacterium]|nr:UvrD-helicase domain-containing protein [Nevskiaceae bacterium]